MGKGENRIILLLINTLINNKGNNIIYKRMRKDIEIRIKDNWENKVYVVNVIIVIVISNQSII